MLQVSHFTADVIQQLWQLLGMKTNFNISPPFHHPQASGQVERANRTVVRIPRRYVAFNQRDLDIKLPLVLMAITATPHGQECGNRFSLGLSSVNAVSMSTVKYHIGELQAEITDSRAQIRRQQHELQTIGQLLKGTNFGG